MRTDLDVFRSAFENPWKELASLQKRIDRFFDSFYSNVPSTGAKSDVDFLPACDVEEKDNQYLISVDVPGIPKEEISVEITGNTLTVSGEHKEEHETEKGKRKLVERYHGRFERSFTLPGISSAERVTADYKDGVLKIAVPKPEAAKSSRVQISESKVAPPKAAPKGEEKKEAKATETRAA